MATPIIETIAAAIQTQLETITVGNGYSVTVADVVRPTRKSGEDNAPGNNIIYLTQGECRDADSDQTPHMFKAWLQTFNIDCYIRPSESVTTAYDTLKNAFRSDVEKCIMSNRSFSLSDCTSFIRAPKQLDDGISVQIEVYYRTLETDPYSTG